MSFGMIEGGSGDCEPANLHGDVAEQPGGGTARHSGLMLQHRAARRVRFAPSFSLGLCFSALANQHCDVVARQGGI